MPPSASTAAWRPPAEPGRTGRVLKIAGVALVALAVAQYLSGFILLWLLHLDPHGASPLTVLRYGYYYGGVPQVREALLRACASGTEGRRVGVSSSTGGPGHGPALSSTGG